MSEIERQMGMLQKDTKRLDQYKIFLDPTKAKNQDDFYAPILPLIGPELSVANIEREDIMSFLRIMYCVQEMFANGQDDLALMMETTLTGELKLTMSKEGMVIGNIFSNKLEYSQTQTVHEHVHPAERQKQGFFSRKPKGEK